MRGHGAHSDRPQTELHVHVYMSPVTKRTLARLPPGRIRSHHHIRVPLTHPPTHVQLCLCQVPMSRAHAAMSTQVHVSGSMQHVPTLVACVSPSLNNCAARAAAAAVGRRRRSYARFHPSRAAKGWKGHLYLSASRACRGARCGLSGLEASVRHAAFW